METIPPMGWNLSGRLGLSVEDVQIIFSLASIVLSVALLAVTLSQSIANHKMVTEMRRQRQDALYDRRVRVFRGVRRTLSHVLEAAQVRGDTIFGLIRAKSEARFFLGKDLCDYLDEIYKRCVKAQVLHVEFKKLPQGPERTELVEQHSNAIGWILDQLPVLVERFSPYLKVEDRR
jgi:hypothetical protein